MARSHVRLKTLDADTLGLSVIVLSEDRALVQLVERSASAALRVVQVTDLDSLTLEIRSEALCCAVFVDLDSLHCLRGPLHRKLIARWPELPTMVWLSSSSTTALAEAHSYGSRHLFKRTPEPMRSRELKAFVAVALHEKLSWLAPRLELARSLDLGATEMETFLTAVIHRVPAPELSVHLGIGERAVQRRNSALCEALGVPPGFKYLEWHVNQMIPSTTSSSIIALERRAIAHRVSGDVDRVGGKSAEQI